MIGVMQVRSHFRPEFINRIDEFTVFNPLNRADIKRIVRLQAKRVEERLTAKKMKMKLLEPAIEFLAVQCSLAIAACKACIYPCSFMVTCVASNLAMMKQHQQLSRHIEAQHACCILGFV